MNKSIPQTYFSEKAYIRVILLLGMGFAILAGLSVLSIIRDRNTYLNESHHITSAKAQVLGENGASVLYDVDVLLNAIHFLWQSHTETDSIVPSTVKKFIQGQLVFLPQVSNITILSADGTLQYSSTPLSTFDTPSFVKHKDEWLDFYAGTSRLDSGKRGILISRRAESYDSKFMGIIAATIDPVVFSNKYENYLNIDVAGIALFDLQGNVLTGWTNQAEQQWNMTGANIRQVAMLADSADEILNSGGRKTFETENEIISSFQLPDFTLQIAVVSDKHSVLATWYRETMFKAGLIAISTLLTGIAILLMTWQIQKRKTAEGKLLKHQQHLEETVTRRTSQLSELNNDLRNKNEDLLRAMNEIQTLSGLLPICSHCKKIRDDSGYWSQLETYIGEHTQAEFSHSICPSCAKIYYPDMDLYDD